MGLESEKARSASLMRVLGMEKGEWYS